MHKSLLEYIDVVAEETSPTSIILAVAELMRKEADASRETAKTSIFVFLDKLKNAGLAIDYTGLKSYFDADPRLSNVIQQFNDREIEFVGQGDEDEAPDTGAPVGEVPPEKKVNQMAKAALAKRESIEESPKAAMQDRARANAQLLGREASNITTGGPDDLDAKKVVSPAAQKLAQQKLAQKQKIEKKAGISSQKAATPANMTKQMANFGENVYGGSPLPMNAIDKIQSIMDNGSAMKIDGVMVDTFTASVIMDIYNKVNEKNQDKMRSMPVEKLASSAYMLANRVKEEVELNEKKVDHQLKIAIDTVKNPLKGKFLGGPSAKEAEKTLRTKYKYTDKMIAKLKEDVYGGSPAPMNTIDKLSESINNVLRLSGIKK